MEKIIKIILYKVFSILQRSNISQYSEAKLMNFTFYLILALKRNAQRNN